MISRDIVDCLGLEIAECHNTITGVGDKRVTLDGLVKSPFGMGSFEHSEMIEWYVSSELESFAFIGLETQKDLGLVIDIGKSQILVQNFIIPFWTSRSELLSVAAVSKPESEEGLIKVELSLSATLPPFSNVIAQGKLVFPDGVTPSAGEYVIDPVLLRREYGLLSLRTVVTAVQSGNDFLVPVSIKNPLPQGLRLLRKSKVGFAGEAQIELEDAKDLGGDGTKNKYDENTHPIDKVNLSHLESGLKTKVQDMLAGHGLAFAKNKYDMGLTSWIEHDIQLKPGEEEPAVEPQRSYPLHKRDIILDTVQELEDCDVIETAMSAWRTFPVLAKKKNPVTGQWENNKRFCQDLRRLNAKTLKHSRLLPKIHEVIDCMGSAQYFTSIDLLGAYHQVPLKESVRDYTAFCVPSGRQYRYKVMTFGLCNASQTFSNLMDLVLANFS